MKKLFLWSALMLFFASAQAQNNQIQTGLSIPDFQPDIVIKGESLKNFPGASVEEMLLGRLPGLSVFHTAGQESEVVYVVDSFIWATIEGLSIHNIEEIAYYRGGLNHQLGVQYNKPQGVIYIKTKSGKYNSKLTTEVNALAGLNRFPEAEPGTTRNIIDGYNIALQQGSEQLAWRGSLVYNRAARNRYEHNLGRQLQFNGDLRYQPVKWAEFGFNFNYAPEKWRTVAQNTMPTPNSKFTRSRKLEREDWNTRLYLKLDFGGGWTNQLSFLRNNNRLEDTLFRTMEHFLDPYKFDYRDDVLQTFQNTSVINELSYRFNLANDQIKLRSSALFQYNKFSQRKDSQTRELYAMGESVAHSIVTSRSSSRLNSLAIGATADFYSILTVQAGLRGDDGVNFMDSKVSYSPFGYTDINIKHLLLKDIGQITALKLFASFGQDRTAFNMKFYDYTIPGDLSNSKVVNDQRMKSMSVGFKASFFNDRLQVNADWSQNDYFTLWNIPIPGQPGGYSSANVFIATRLSGWRTWLNLDVLSASALKWNAGFNVSKNNMQIRDIQGMDQFDGLQFEKGKPQLGMQHQFSYEKVFLSANAYAYFDQQHLQINNSTAPTTFLVEGTLFDLNYLALGYAFKGIETIQSGKDLRVSLIGRNLLQHKKGDFNANLTKTIGLALNMQF